MAVFFQETVARIAGRRDHTKRDLIAIFIVAVALGIGIKMVATRTITIGFEDYTLRSMETAYDIDALQKRLIEAGNVSSRKEQAANACTE